MSGIKKSDSNGFYGERLCSFILDIPQKRIIINSMINQINQNFQEEQHYVKIKNIAIV